MSEFLIKAVITVWEDETITDIMEIEPTSDCTIIGFISCRLSEKLRFADPGTKIDIKIITNEN